MTAAADVLVTGRVATLAGEAGFGWVQAIAVRAGRVVAAGGARDLEPLGGPGTRRIAIGPDEVVLPGLTDAHLHLADAALAARRVDLARAANAAEALGILDAAVRALADLPDAWLLGQRWNAAAWGGWPLATDLDAVTGERPAFLWSHDHHAAWVNTAALARAGIGPGTRDPAGGLIRRLPDGTPSGTLHEQAVRLVADLVPAAGPDDLDAAIVEYARELLRLGLVAVHDPGPTGLDPRLEAGFAAYRRLDERGALPLRVYASVRSDSLELAIERGLRTGDALVAGSGAEPGTVRARMGWLKLFADGAFGSRTAALRDPYETDRERGSPVGGDRGMFVTEPPELRRLVELARAGGIASQIHAIGDAAVSAALDALAPVARAASIRARPRIEHVQLLDPPDADRFAGFAIAASVQPGHLVGDAAMARAALGPRADERGYPLASLASRGVPIPFGSDAPVESPDPWPGIAMAVTRRSGSWGRGVPAFGSSEALSLSRAIRGAVLDASLVAGESDSGRLVPGCRADFVVIPAEALREPAAPSSVLDSVRPSLVAVGGELVVGG